MLGDHLGMTSKSLVLTSTQRSFWIPLESRSNYYKYETFKYGLGFKLVKIKNTRSLLIEITIDV